ncbi:MAG: thioesterase family protein [Oscillospiraceae bacterium]|nr:thioesterase family protein [Oscillospiraceae bacterium]MBR1497172.1 thioesterase family protein [Oscillospiraceae bacterium]
MEIGESFELKRIVTEDITAAAAGSGGLQVFGTPFLIAMMENAAWTVMQRSLPEGKTSVGTKVDVAHTAPTPLGMEVTVRAEVVAVSPNGKMVDFKVSASDAAGPIGEGTHQRAVIDAECFLSKCEARKGAGA